jgi:hypothetical protein
MWLIPRIGAAGVCSHPVRRRARRSAGPPVREPLQLHIADPVVAQHGGEGAQPDGVPRPDPAGPIRTRLTPPPPPPRCGCESESGCDPAPARASPHPQSSSTREATADVGHSCHFLHSPDFSALAGTDAEQIPHRPKESQSMRLSPTVTTARRSAPSSRWNSTAGGDRGFHFISSMCHAWLNRRAKRGNPGSRRLATKALENTQVISLFRAVTRDKDGKWPRGFWSPRLRLHAGAGALVVHRFDDGGGHRGGGKAILSGG